MVCNLTLILILIALFSRSRHALLPAVGLLTALAVIDAVQTRRIILRDRRRGERARSSEHRANGAFVEETIQGAGHNGGEHPRVEAALIAVSTLHDKGDMLV